MKDFDTRYAVNGSSALRLESSHMPRLGRVISFPGLPEEPGEEADSRAAEDAETIRHSTRCLSAHLDDLRGVPFDQLTRTSEIALGVLFSGVTALFVFLGM